MKKNVIAPLVLQKFIWIPTRLTLKIFGRLEIKGLEKLKGITTPIIFAVNHSSEIDPFMVPASLPFWSRFSPLFYATKEKSFYSTNGWRKHMFGGLFINAWGGYTAISGFRNYGKSLAKHVALLKAGCSFCVFPEGSITKTGQIQEAKGGIAYLAQSNTCTVVPVAVSGVYGMSVKDFFTRKRKITINFGKPIASEALHRESRNDIAKQNHMNVPKTNINRYKEEANYIMRKVGELLES